MLRERPFENYQDYELIYEDYSIISYKLKGGIVNKKDCELCNSPHSYLLVIKNKAYGYNIRIPLCTNEYEAILSSLKRLNSHEKGLKE